MKERDGHIHVLPLHVANKIAAGEVVERPASVVKELVENAIDAGAKSIKISISQGGRKLISVQDDGCGMTRDDAILSLERQATSKILDVCDIEEIDTLGFRGEAIPSIASVSRFSISTRRRDSEEGTRLEVNAGILASVGATGCPPGTIVEVRDLFCNVPARKKFLRAYTTEEAHVKNIFTINALAHPGIAFSLYVDGRESFRLREARSPMERIRELFGDDFSESLLSVEESGEKASVSGFIERPNKIIPTRRDQYIFVNSRPATSSAIHAAIKEAYPRQHGDGRPAAILFISVPPKDLDVNVHPQKREVRFREGTAVKNAIINAIKRAIGIGDTKNEYRQAKTAGDSEGANEVANEAIAIATPIHKEVTRAGAIDSKIESIASEKAVSKVESTSNSVLANTNIIDIPQRSFPKAVPTEQSLPLSSPGGKKAKPWVWFKFLAITDSGFILIETDAGIVTVNPRAARERIAFESMVSRLGEEASSQELLFPEIIQLPPADAHRIATSLEQINAIGFRLEPFGNSTFKIEAVPQILGEIPCKETIATIASDLANASASPKTSARWREDVIAKSIAKSYAGSSTALENESAKRLVEELVECKMPYICPRGKATMIFTSNRELDRKFGRY